MFTLQPDCSSLSNHNHQSGPDGAVNQATDAFKKHLLRHTGILFSIVNLTFFFEVPAISSIQVVLLTCSYIFVSG